MYGVQRLMELRDVGIDVERAGWDTIQKCGLT